MQFDEATLAKEIRALSRGAGVHKVLRLRQLDPQLRLVCGIADGAPSEQTKAALRARVEHLLKDAELQTCLLAALGLHPAARDRSLGVRLACAAAQCRFSKRTAERRADSAVREFARLAVESTQESSSTDPGFVLKSLRDDLILTGSLPRYIMSREITVVAEELPAIPAAFAIEAPPPGGEPSFDFRVTAGGTGCFDIHRRDCTVRYQVGLDRPLVRGETHEYVVELVLPDWRLLKRRYAVAPQTTIHSATLSVTFHPRCPPDEVWLINGVLAGEVEHRPPDSLVRPDPSGVIRTSFSSLTQGLYYGLAWSENGSAVPAER